MGLFKKKFSELFILFAIFYGPLLLLLGFLIPVKSLRVIANMQNHLKILLSYANLY